MWYSAIIAQSNGTAADHLASVLRAHFREVAVVYQPEQLRHRLAEKHFQVAVVDLELFTFRELTELCRTQSDVAIICTHRIADEQMWVASLEAGAADCCHDQDVNGIVHAVTSLWSPAKAGGHAA